MVETPALSDFYPKNYGDRFTKSEKYNIIKFDALYSRIGTMFITHFKCDVCRKEKKVLGVDSSMEEYGPGYICMGCIKDLFGKEET